MHFVTGGAFNGKARWVKTHYRLEAPFEGWLSAYHPALSGERLEAVDTFHDVTVIQGFEHYVKELAAVNDGAEAARKRWWNLFVKWKNWEEETARRRLVVIGNDISKGVVPVDEKARFWRDLTGWSYQDLVAISDRVDLVWYGIAKQLK